MNNKIIYFEDNFPQYYMKGSRDFQLLARLLTLVLNSSKVEADSLLYLNDPILISDRLLPLMQTKVGFWTNYEFTNDQLRLACDAFDTIVRYKGSRQGIVQAIEVYLKTLGISTEFDILIVNKDFDGTYKYTIDVGIKSNQYDATLLQEILKYILPTGYISQIYFYDEVDFGNYETLKRNGIQYSDFVILSAGDKFPLSQLRTTYYQSSLQEWSVGGLVVSSEKTKSGNVDVEEPLKNIQSIDMTEIY